METISLVLTDVTNWERLAGLLNIKVIEIKTNCQEDLAKASCYRRGVVRQYCDSQQSEDSSKVAENIAKILEQMGHNLQAQNLRKLFGKSVVNLSSLLGRDGMLPIGQHG